MLTGNQKGKMRTLTYNVDSNCRKQVLPPGLRGQTGEEVGLTKT